MSSSPFTLTSSQFSDGEALPAGAAHPSTGGGNVSPDLRWSGAPAGTRSFAVTCHDPDAPTDIGFVHWVLFGIDAATTSLEAGAGTPGHEPGGASHGFTDWGENSWGGMAPPAGDDAHRYTFTVYALAVQTGELPPTTTYAKFRFATGADVLGTATLTGRYAVPA